MSNPVIKIFGSKSTPVSFDVNVTGTTADQKVRMVINTSDQSYLLPCKKKEGNKWEVTIPPVRATSFEIEVIVDGWFAVPIKGKIEIDEPKEVSIEIEQPVQQKATKKSTQKEKKEPPKEQVKEEDLIIDAPILERSAQKTQIDDIIKNVLFASAKQSESTKHNESTPKSKDDEIREFLRTQK